VERTLAGAYSGGKVVRWNGGTVERWNALLGW
jgi:hypothetical protein